MSRVLPHSWLDEHGRMWLVTVVPYVLLGALVVVTAVVKHAAGASLWVDLGLCAVAFAWMLWVFTLHPHWRGSTTAMVVFFAVLVGIVAVLVVRDPWFGFFAPAGYFYAFRILPWPWVLAGVAAVGMIAGTAQASSADLTTTSGVLVFIAVVAANVAPMCGFAWLAARGAERNDERKRTLAALSETNRRLEASLAENAGLQRQLLDQAREAGVLDERQRMAREIHDTLAQGLTGIITQLQAAQQAAADPARWHRHVTAATGLARESLSEARRSVHALRPEPLRESGLGEALAEVARRWSDLNDVEVLVTTTGAVRPLPEAAELALLRTAQEALTNVAKHAGATRVGLTLSYLEGEVALDVRDDGAGFAVPRPEWGGGFGLVAMRQRVEGLAGTLRIESEPGAGTAVSACIPMGSPA
jgi:signal transduction histidine kinase